MAVADGFDVRGGCRAIRQRRRSHTIDDPSEVAVADRLAVLAERDDRLVHLVDFAVREAEPKRLASRLHGMPPEWRPSTRRDEADWPTSSGRMIS